MCLFVCVCVGVPLCVPGAGGGQKRVSDPLELELQTVVSHFVGTGS